MATAEGNVTIPEMTFEVIADPQIALDEKRARMKKFLLYLAVTSFFLWLLYKFAFPYLKIYFAKYKNVFKKKKISNTLEKNLNP